MGHRRYDHELFRPEFRMCFDEDRGAGAENTAFGAMLRRGGAGRRGDSPNAVHFRTQLPQNQRPFVPSQPILGTPTRRLFLARLSAAVAASVITRPASARPAPSKILIPKPSVPWPQATRIIGGPDWFAQYPAGTLAEPGNTDPGFNDFCLIQDKSNRWHCIGISAEMGNDSTLFHGVSDHVDGHYTVLPRIHSGVADEKVVRHMWAPFAVWKDTTTALLFYAHIETDPKDDSEITTMRVLESRDPKLESWHPLNASQLPQGNIAFSEHFDRDPMILWDDDRRCYLMYYVVGNGWADPEPSNVVCVRQSSDLITWGPPKTLMSPPTGYRASESVYVIKRNGYYYMWVCGFDYGRMSLYISDDPLNFGDPDKNRIMEQSGHSPEFVQVDGRDLIACVSVATTFGNRPGRHDLHGVYIQPLTWAEPDPDMLAKVVRTAAK